MGAVFSVCLSVAGIYLMVGLVFAVAFALHGAAKIDPTAAAGTWGFKLAIIPASAVLWPMLLLRWLKGTGVPPEECSPHRKAAGSCECRCGKIDGAAS